MMQYETFARSIELLAMIIMAIAFYYGYSLMKFIPNIFQSIDRPGPWWRSVHCPRMPKLRSSVLHVVGGKTYPG